MNEDRVIVLDNYGDYRSGPLIVALADGVGGRAGGAEAAELFVSCIQENVERVRRGEFRALMQEADEHILTSSTAGETTGVVVSEKHDWRGRRVICGASVGDSEAWLILADEIAVLTQRARRKPYLGSGGAVPTLFQELWGEGWTLLVASDGLFKYAAPETIARIVAGDDLEAIAEQLIAQVRYPSGNLPDDVSLVLAR